jgi:pSer/pThr/pTyr-binding forkhead associated (FHA) protein
VSLDVLFLVLRFLAALILYLFIAGVILVLWRDLRAASTYALRIPLAYLDLEGMGDECSKFKLQEENIIGRAAENTIPIVDETVSTRHARLAFYKGQWLLEDLGSRNGTKVNDIPVNEPLALADGDRIQLGKVTARFERNPSESEPVQD